MAKKRPICEFDEATLVARLDVTVAGDLRAVTPAVEKIMEIVSEMPGSRIEGLLEWVNRGR